MLITLSADHGFMNIPEYSASRSLDAGRIDPDKMIEGVNAALSAGSARASTSPRGGTRTSTSTMRWSMPAGSAAWRSRMPPRLSCAATRASKRYSPEPSWKTGSCRNTKLAKQVSLAWHQQISGDIVVMNKPNWYLFAKPTTYASTHGSPWAYDTNVPLAMYGPSWIKPGKYGDLEVVDLARTIAFILNVRPPNGCEGRVLSELLN